MQRLDLTLTSPAANLALDEALLLHAEEGAEGEVLRFWMSPQPFVVIGVGARIEREARLTACQDRGIPVLRRCSGGGTVVQGPGCLSYSLILRIPEAGPLSTVQGTNQFIMRRHAYTLSALIKGNLTVEGHTDLAVDGVKVSGNAQRRLRRHLLFHGTFLTGFDLTLITDLLPLPDRQPEYRRQRSHGDFVRNLDVAPERIRNVLLDAWEATATQAEAPMQRVAALVKERYDRREWHCRQ